MSDVAAPAQSATSGASEAARPAFSPIAVLWIVLAGVFSFSAFMVLSAYAPDMRGGSDGGAHALSRSAVGYAGMVRLLRAEGENVVISRRMPTPVAAPAPVAAADSAQAPTQDPAAPSDAPDNATATGNQAPPSTVPPPQPQPQPQPQAPNVIAAATADDDNWSLLIATPGVDPPKDSLTNITARGPTLVVAPKWLTLPDPLTPGWVNQVGLIDPAPIQKMLAPIAARLTLARRTDTSAAQLVGSTDTSVKATGPIEDLQTFQGSPDLVPVITDQRGGVVLAATPDRHVYFLSDPDLLNNHGIASLETARQANDLIRSLRNGDGPIAFDVSLNGFGAAPSLLKLAFSPPYLGATLCLVAVGFLIALHAASRFGAPLRAGRTIAFGKRALADNSAALIRLARREPRMAGRYLDLSRAAVVKALGAGRVPAGEVDAFLDRLAEKSGARHRLAALVREAAAVKTRADLTKLAQSLYQWRVEMTGERR